MVKYITKERDGKNYTGEIVTETVEMKASINPDTPLHFKVTGFVNGVRVYSSSTPSEEAFLELVQFCIDAVGEEMDRLITKESKDGLREQLEKLGFIDPQHQEDGNDIAD